MFTSSIPRALADGAIVINTAEVVLVQDYRLTRSVWSEHPSLSWPWALFANSPRFKVASLVLLIYDYCMWFYPLLIVIF